MPAQILRIRNAYEGWTRLLVVTVADEEGAEFNREVEDHGRVVAVLPYDPERRVAVLVSTLRAPVIYAGYDHLLEAPAGMLDEEVPEEAARREVLEETGLRLRALEHVARAFSSPGLSTESVDLYLAPYHAQDRVSKGGGLAQENERVTVHEIALSALWSLIESNEILDLKTVTLGFALRHRHPELF